MSAEAPVQLAQDAALPAQPGQLVSARNTKHDGGAHWVVPGTYLGHDEFGHWVAQPEGSFVSRPGHAFFAPSPALLLVPFAGDWVATFYGPWNPGKVSLYVDMVAEIAWQSIENGTAWEMTLVDMDLDVVIQDGRLYIDDEDEFAEHQEHYGYSPELIAATQSACDWVYATVAAERAPFDGRDTEWFATARSRGLISSQFS